MINLKKMTWDYFAFDRMDVFFKKIIGMRAECFLENGPIFDKIWASEHRFFRKNRKESAT